MDGNDRRVIRARPQAQPREKSVTTGRTWWGWGWGKAAGRVEEELATQSVRRFTPSLTWINNKNRNRVWVFQLKIYPSCFVSWVKLWVLMIWYNFPLPLPPLMCHCPAPHYLWRYCSCNMVTSLLKVSNPVAGNDEGLVTDRSWKAALVLVTGCWRLLDWRCGPAESIEVKGTLG